MLQFLLCVYCLLLTVTSFEMSFLPIHEAKAPQSSGQNYVSKIFFVDLSAFNKSLHEVLLDSEFKALHLTNNSKTTSSLPLSEEVSEIPNFISLFGFV